MLRVAVEACVSLDVRERGPMESTTYHAFCDPSGGSADSMTLAIGHKEGDIIVLDALRERKPPFSPEDVVTEFSELLKTYHVSKIVGDRYAGEWPRERFREHEITYEPAAKPKSDLYRDLLPLINSSKLDLLDHQRLVSQLCGLERRTARGGRDSIDHAPGAAHDDIANCVAGVATLLAAAVDHTNLDWIFGPNDAHASLSPRALSLAEKADFARQQLHAFVWSDGGRWPPWSLLKNREQSMARVQAFDAVGNLLDDDETCARRRQGRGAPSLHGRRQLRCAEDRNATTTTLTPKTPKTPRRTTAIRFQFQTSSASVSPTPMKRRKSAFRAACFVTEYRRRQTICRRRCRRRPACCGL